MRSTVSVSHISHLFECKTDVRIRELQLRTGETLRTKNITLRNQKHGSRGYCRVGDVGILSAALVGLIPTQH